MNTLMSAHTGIPIGTESVRVTAAVPGFVTSTSSTGVRRRNSSPIWENATIAPASRRIEPIRRNFV